MKQTTKKIIAWLIVISLVLVVGLTFFCGITGSRYFFGMLMLMFFYPIILWLILFFYKNNKK